jgi:hypothetical protein
MKRLKPSVFKRLHIRAQMLDLISSLVSFRKIAKARNISVTSVYRFFYRLQKDGLISKEKELSFKGKKLVQDFIVVSDKGKRFVPQPDWCRLHDIQFCLKPIKKPTDWNNRRLLVFRDRVRNYSEWDVKGWRENIFWVEDVEVRTTPSSVLVRLQDIFQPSPVLAGNYAMSVLFRVLPKLESLLGVELARPSYVNISIGKQHHALIFNEIAKWFLERGVECRILDESGSVRVIVDDSEDLKELEAVHPRFAEDDAQKLKDLVSDVVFREGLLPSQAKRRIEDIDVFLDRQNDLNFKLNENLSKFLDNLLAVQEFQKKILSSNEKVLERIIGLENKLKPRK